MLTPGMVAGSTARYQGSSVPVVPNTFPNEPTFVRPNYGFLYQGPTDLADGSTPSARDRLKEIGVALAEGIGRAVYAKIDPKQQERRVPTTGYPASNGQLDQFANRAGLTKGQLLVFGVLMVLLLIGIMKG